MVEALRLVRFCLAFFSRQVPCLTPLCTLVRSNMLWWTTRLLPALHRSVFGRFAIYCLFLFRARTGRLKAQNFPKCCLMCYWPVAHRLLDTLFRCVDQHLLYCNRSTQSTRERHRSKAFMFCLSNQMRAALSECLRGVLGADKGNGCASCSRVARSQSLHSLGNKKGCLPPERYECVLCVPQSLRYDGLTE